MKQAVKKGFGFGLTSGVITTIGLMIGLYATTPMLSVVIGGILSIAVADAFSDAFGIHLSEEVDNHKTEREVWTATGVTFFAKLLIALSFLIPFFLVSFSWAIFINILWGILLLALFSFYIARERKVSAWPIITEHVTIMFGVVVISHLVGKVIAYIFK